MAIILIIAVILFGKRLPEVGRSVGKSIVEFKKGLKGVEEEVAQAAYSSGNSSSARIDPARDNYEKATAPKFEPPRDEHSA